MPNKIRIELPLVAVVCESWFKGLCGTESKQLDSFGALNSEINRYKDGEEGQVS
jgi:hypothetical protein